MGYFPEKCGCISVSYIVMGYTDVCDKHWKEGRRVRKTDIYGDPLPQDSEGRHLYDWNMTFEKQE